MKIKKRNSCIPLKAKRKGAMLRIIALVAMVLLSANVFSGCQKQQEQQNKSSETQKGDPVPIKIFANFDSAELTDPDKAYIDAVEKATNTKISFEVPPSTNYAERLNIMLASGDYADVVYFPYATTKAYIDAINNGIIIPVTKYLDRYPNIKKYSYPVSLDTLKVKGDDEIYGIPRTTITRIDGFVLRQDWLDSIGFKVPADNLITLDQYQEILTKFTKNDPDKNGKNDTYGLAASQNADGTLSFNASPSVTGALGLYGWQKTSGEKYEYMDPTYSLESDTYKKALEFFAKLVRDGTYDPNFTSQKDAVAKNRFLQGITGVYNSFAGLIVTTQEDIAKVNPNAKLTYINGVKDAKGKFGGASSSTGLWGLWSVTSAAKDPEAVIKVFDWLLGDEGWPLTKYGVEGVTYNKEGTNLVPTEQFSKYVVGTNLVRRNNDPEFFVKLNIQKEYKEPMKYWIDTAIKGTVQSLDISYRPAAADKPELIDYQKQLDQTRAKIILGQAPASDWDKVLEGWYKAGGEEYVKQMNDFIKKNQAKK